MGSHANLKVALIKPYQRAVCNSMSPPLGVLYLAASVRQALGERVSVQALDARLYSLSAEEVCRSVRDADIVGLGRGAFAYPDFARDLTVKGALDPKKCCITCSRCTQIMRDGGRTGCVVFDREVYGPIYKAGR